MPGQCQHTVGGTTMTAGPAWGLTTRPVFGGTSNL